MITKIKLIVMAGAAFVMTMLYALLQTEKRKRAQEKLKAEQKAREVEKLGVEAAFIGLKKESEVSRETIDVNNRDHFTK